MRTYCRAFVLLVVSILLSGCAKSILARIDNPDTGYVVIGLRALKAPELNALEVNLSLVRSYLLGIPKYDRGRLIFCRYPTCEKATYQTDKHAGLVIVRRLPVGKYTLDNVSVYLREADGFGFSRETSGIGFFDLGAELTNYGFEVKSAETSYVGNITVKELVKPGELLSPDRHARLAISDRQNEDLAYATEKLPDVPKVVTNYFKKNTTRGLDNIVLANQRKQGKTAPQLKSEVPSNTKHQCNWAC